MLKISVQTGFMTKSLYIYNYLYTTQFMFSFNALHSRNEEDYQLIKMFFSIPSLKLSPTVKKRKPIRPYSIIA